MILKQRTVPNVLKIMRFLNVRKELSEEEKKYLDKLEKGYQGELMFDQLTKKLKNDFIIINDLRLEWNNSTFQIDTLIITQFKIYPFEVKNLGGDYIFEDGEFQIKLSGTEIQNPLEQLNRIKIYLKQILQKLGSDLPIEGYVVFVNPEFTLYQSPVKASLVYPTQLNRFLNKFDQKTSKLTNGHSMIAETLVSLHQPKSPQEKIPAYNYEEMKKGVICPNCNCVLASIGVKKTKCDVCGYVVDNKLLILRSTEEFKTLFPDKKVTTSGIYNWSNGDLAHRQIARVLKANYNQRGSCSSTYFE